MVKVLANGDIVQDDKQQGVQSSRPDRPATFIPQRMGSVNNVNRANAGSPSNANLSVFDAINQRLTTAGVPTWHAGPYTVRPVVSLGFLLSLVLMGFNGLLFSVILFLVAKYSQHGWSSDDSDRTAVGSSSQNPPPSPSSRSGAWPGTGQRLGNQ